MKFKKIYVEITNRCNFNCSFCFKTTRANKFMSPEDFQLIVNKIRPFTDYIYLHVLGEPMLHPKIDEILGIAAAATLQVNITTNGSLLENKKEILKKHTIRQFNISLHDAEENIDEKEWSTYLDNILEFALLNAHKSYISLRLWNTSNKASAPFISLCLNKIAAKFDLSMDVFETIPKGNGMKLTNNIFLHRAPRFEWPDERHPGVPSQKTCYALRDHIAILADGKVIPCCLDADAKLLLGDIHTQDLSTILETEKAQRIKHGFLQRKVVEPLCASCGFIID